MPDVLMVNGKIENIFDHNDFARMLGEKLGSDVERYFRDNCLCLENYNPEELDSVCTGECTHTYKIQEHYENVLREIKHELETAVNSKNVSHTMKLKLELILNLTNGEL